MKIFFFLIFAFAFVANTFAQTDREFWFAAPDVDAVDDPLYGKYDRPIYLRLTTAALPATVTLSLPANTTFTPIVTTIAANSTFTLDLTNWIDLIENFEANQINNKGILIQSNADITAYYEVNSITCQCNPELFSLKGKNAIGNEFFVPSQLTWSIDTIRHPNARAAFDIVATQNNTSITITPANALTGRPANIPFIINLNKGQTFSSQALYRNGINLLNGSIVVADKPIAVTTKEDLLFSDGPCADLAGDQLVPTSVLGTEYGVVRGNLTLRDKVAITATQNNTTIYLDGSATPAATINAGQLFEVDITDLPTLYIKTNKPVYVLHYTGNGCEVGAGLIPKLNCTGSSSVSIVRSNSGDADVLLITRTGNQAGFLVNGNTGIISATDFAPLPGTGGNYVFCKKNLNSVMAFNTATLFSNSTGKFQLGFLNGESGGHMYGYFSDFKKSNVSASQVEVCKSDSVQLNAFGGVTYQWSPANGLSSSTASNPKASPMITTDYKVLITDAEGCVDSAFVKVVVNNCNNTTEDIINDYTPVLSLEPNPCKNILIVEDASRFNTGDTVLLIQMNGAIIDSTNSANFGSVINTKNAGKYEFNFIRNKTANTIELSNIITRNYDITEGKIQLVRVPYYESRTISRTLSCLPWDGNKGGVLVLNVKGTLDLQANIDVTGKGFRGGASANNDIRPCNNDDFYYSSPADGGEKGEGISSISVAKIYGKGKLANAGGGGNSDNGGGGGGGNSGAGGNGGKQWQGCSPDLGTGNGIGGSLLNNNASINRAYMGGAGGMGHANDNIGNFPAGNGGGIAMIFCNTLLGNNHKIAANGANAIVCPLGNGCTDGASGGGGGGSIFVDAPIVNSNCTLEAKGGNGADNSYNDPITFPGTRLGTGGGGGGGLVAIKQTVVSALLVTNVNGGLNGVNTSHGNDPHGSTPGSSGAVINSFNTIWDAIPFKKNIDSVRINDSMTTNCNSFDFKGLAFTNGIPIISWQWYFGDGNTSSQQNTSHSFDSPNTYNVKLKVTDADNCIAEDSTIVTSRTPPQFSSTPALSICNASPVQLNARGGDIYKWSPAAELNNANISNPIATPSVNTTFTVTITDTVCKVSQDLTTTVTLLPSPDVEIDEPKEIDCSSPAIQLNATGASQYNWSPGSGLSNGNINNPIVSVDTTTTYIVKGTDSNGCFGFDTTTVKVTKKGTLLFDMPNAFTPNKDGHNDCFGLGRFSGFVQSFQLSVYNRWGQRIFYTTNPGTCWDGTFKGNLQSSGGYIYLLKAKTFCGDFDKKGLVMLLR